MADIMLQALNRSNSLRSRAISILFLGTPHRGSSYAEWGQTMSNLARIALQDSNKNILKALEVDSEVLENIHDRFKNVVTESEIKIYSFQEARGISGVKGLHGKVVSDYSSRLDPPSDVETVQTVDANHTQMVKCMSRDDPQYRDILRVLRNVIRNTSVAIAQPPMDEKRKRLLADLYVLPYEDRKNVNPRRVPGTCEWFTNHPRFKGWQEEHGSSLLWVSADPGCGKSVLARYLVDDVFQATNPSSPIVCYFFFKDDSKDQRSPENAIRCILHRIFTRKPALLSDAILREFEQKGGMINTSFDSLWDIFTKVVSNKYLGRITCVVDALDECEGGYSRLTAALCQFFGSEKSKSSSSMKFLLTSRPYIQIQRDFRILENRLPTIHLNGENEEEVDKIRQEIDIVITKRLEHVSEKLQLSSEQQQLLQCELTRVEHRTYLWVYLIFDAIEKSIWITEDDLLASIRKLPRTVEAAYEKILSRSPNQVLAKRLLHIVVAAERPFSLKEMAEALAIEERNGKSIKSKVQGEEQFRNSVKELCGLFVVIIRSEIHLLHQTAREFLIRKPAPDEPGNLNHNSDNFQWRFSFEPAVSHRILAEICIWQLLLDTISHKPPLGYWNFYWRSHWRQAQVEDDAPIQDSSYSLLYPDLRSNSIKDLIISESRLFCDPDFDDDDESYNAALVYASHCGLEEIVKRLLKTPTNATGKLLAFRSAARAGHVSVAELLLDNLETPRLLEPLCEAIAWDNERHCMTIAKMFLDKGIDLNVFNSCWKWPLYHAVKRNRKSIIQLLIENGADVNAVDCYGGTILFQYLNEPRCRDSIQLLLENGLDCSIKNKQGQTALWRVVTVIVWGTGDISTYQRWLLELLIKEVDINARYTDGQSVLWQAVESPTRNLPSLLIENGADIDIKDDDGRTPLWNAALYRAVSTVQLLLEKGADVNLRDNDGRTVLWAATRQLNKHDDKYVKIIQILEQNGAIMD